MRACRDQSDQTGTVPAEGKKHASPQSSRRLGSRAPAFWKAVEATLMARQSIPEVTATLNYAYTFKMQTAHLWETVPCFQDPFPSKRCPVGQGLGSSFPPQKKKKLPARKNVFLLHPVQGEPKENRPELSHLSSSPQNAYRWSLPGGKINLGSRPTENSFRHVLRFSSTCGRIHLTRDSFL